MIKTSWRLSALASLALLATGCVSTEQGVRHVSPTPAQELDATAAPTTATPAAPVADLLPDSPGPMEQGDFLTASWEELTTDELASRVPDFVFDRSVDGAFATAWYYLGEAASSQVSRDLTVLHNLATDSCGWCASQEQIVLDAATQNLRLTGWEYTPIEGAEPSMQHIDEDTYVFFVPFSRTELRIWAPDGSLQQADPAVDNAFHMQMVFADGAWRVDGIGLGEVEWDPSVSEPVETS